MSNSDRLPDYPLNSDLVRRLKSALDARDEDRVGHLICTEVGHVDAVIELANEDWMKEPSAQLPAGVLVVLEYYAALVMGDLSRLERLMNRFFQDANVVFEIKKDEMEWQVKSPATFGLSGLWTLEYKRELTTPLCIAAARGHTACVRHLLSRGADPDASPGGQGALHEACLGGHTACAQLLLQHSADPDLLSAEGLAPLHLCRTAASLGQTCEARLSPVCRSGNRGSSRTHVLHVRQHRGVTLCQRYREGIAEEEEGKLGMCAARGDTGAACRRREGTTRQVCSKTRTWPGRTDAQDGGPGSQASEAHASWVRRRLASQGERSTGFVHRVEAPRVLSWHACAPEPAPQRTVQVLLNHGSPTVWPDAFPKVLKACAAAPTVIETLFNAYPQLRVSESWREVIPEEVLQMHQAFYQSFFALAHAPRSLQHLCRCAIRKLFGKKCFHLVPLLPLPKSLQNYLLLEPEGVLH
ncbi:hypothetical protein PANDA_009999, partial [Ailuropoda melanoleuca]